MSPLTRARLVLWIAMVAIQVCLFGEYHISLRASKRDTLLSLPSPSSRGCEYFKAKVPLPTNYSTTEFQDLSPNSGIQYDQLKLHMPSVYKNVNYTLAHQVARPFPSWRHPFPCFPTEPDWYTIKRQKQPSKQGFFYFKARKAGSSTVAGVALRIARAKAKQIRLATTAANATHCHTRYGHPAAHRLKYHQRDRLHSFLWSIIREPTKRDVSEFFHFGVSRGAKMSPSRQSFQSYHEYNPLMHEYYLQFMSTDRAYKMERDDYIQSVAKIMSDYDFIGITERMHESLVALQLVLNLTTSDILFLSAKTSGGWDDGLSEGQCFYIRPPVVSPQLQQYFQSDDWMQKTQGGNLLYAAVNRSLDLTISSFDQTVFQKQLTKYKWALKEAHLRCVNKVKFPCSAGGILQERHDCLLWDSGCGYDCLDQVAEELGL